VEKKIIINNNKMPAVIGSYSPAVKKGNILFWWEFPIY
jgi:hypothetical protein